MYRGYSSQFVQGQASNPPNPYLNQPFNPLYPVPVPQMGYPPNSYNSNQPPNYYSVFIVSFIAPIVNRKDKICFATVYLTIAFTKFFVL